jgi:hypothetical protein
MDMASTGYAIPIMKFCFMETIFLEGVGAAYIKELKII